MNIFNIIQVIQITADVDRKQNRSSIDLFCSVKQITSNTNSLTQVRDYWNVRLVIFVGGFYRKGC